MVEVISIIETNLLVCPQQPSKRSKVFLDTSDPLPCDPSLDSIMVSVLKMVPLYDEVNLEGPMRKYLRKMALEDIEMASTDLSARDTRAADHAPLWKLLDTMLALIVTGKLTQTDLTIWSRIVDNFDYHRKLRNSALAEEINKTSKRMSWILRHGDDDPRIASNRLPGGGISLEFLVNVLDCKPHEDLDLKSQYGPLADYLFVLGIVGTDPKERFHVILFPRQGRAVPVTVICAAQGHSIDIPEEISYLRRITEDQVEGLGVVFHGTSLKCTRDIEKESTGPHLRRMTRTHLHFYSTHEMSLREISINDLAPRSREYCYVFVGIKEWIQAGHVLLKAPNGVVLSPTDVPFTDGQDTTFIVGMQRFPVIQKYHRRWHPGSGDPTLLRRDQRKPGRVNISVREDPIPPPPKGPPPRPSSSSSTGSAQPETPPKAPPKFPPKSMPRPSSRGPAPSSSSDGPPPGWNPWHSEESSSASTETKLITRRRRRTLSCPFHFKRKRSTFQDSNRGPH